MSEYKNLKTYVEDKIVKYTFWAKNFNKEEMDMVDAYCKSVYDNNRKLMILDLIRYKEESLPIILLNDKINLMYKELSDNIKEITPKKVEETKPVKKVWKGFGETK